MKAARKILAIALALMLALSSMAVFADEEQNSGEYGIAPLSEGQETGGSGSTGGLETVKPTEKPEETQNPGTTNAPATAEPPETNEPAETEEPCKLASVHDAKKVMYSDIEEDYVKTGIFVVTERVEGGDCKVEQYVKYTCTECGKEGLKAIIKEAEKDHNFASQDPQVFKHKTSCTEAGYEVQKCTNPGCTVTKDVAIKGEEAAKEHDPDAERIWVPAADSIKATCAQEGYEHGYWACGAVLYKDDKGQDVICKAPLEQVDQHKKLTHTWVCLDATRNDLDDPAVNPYFKVEIKVVDNKNVAVITGLQPDYKGEVAKKGSVMTKAPADGTYGNVTVADIKIGKTCEDDTVYTLKCDLCNETHTETIKGAGRQWVDLDYNSPDEYGDQDDELGGFYFTTDNDGNSYEYGFGGVEPTCYAGGSKWQYCLTCLKKNNFRTDDFDAFRTKFPGETRMLDVPKREHNFYEIEDIVDGNRTDWEDDERLVQAVKNIVLTTAAGEKFTDIYDIIRINTNPCCIDYTITIPCSYDDASTGLPCKGTTTIARKADSATAHDYEMVVKPKLKCGETGTAVYVCQLCKKVIEEEYANPNTQHVWKEQVLTAPTCTKEGSKKLTCKLCDEVQTVVMPQLPHTPVNGKDYVAADCVNKKDGLNHQVCKVCGTELKRDVIKWETAHAPGSNKVTTVPATCGKAGSKTFDCALCGAKNVVVEIKALEHKFEGEEVVLQKLSCEKDLIVAKACTQPGCKAHGPEYVKTKAPGHHKPDDPDKIATIKKADCQTGEAGTIRYNCDRVIDGKVCGEVITATVEAKHDFRLVTPTDRVHAAYKQCVVCGATEEFETISTELVLDLDGVTISSTGTTGTATFTTTNQNLVPANEWDRFLEQNVPEPYNEDLVARITWAFKLESGESFAFVMCRDLRWPYPVYEAPGNYEATFNMGGLSAPAGATLNYVNVIITDTKNAESVPMSDLYSYVSKTTTTK